MKCPHCKKEINIGAMIGSKSSPAKSAAARANGRKGGRPKKKPIEGGAKPPANVEDSQEGWPKSQNSNED